VVILVREEDAESARAIIEAGRQSAGEDATEEPPSGE
jgi:hypothetical protein